MFVHVYDLNGCSLNNSYYNVVAISETNKAVYLVIEDGTLIIVDKKDSTIAAFLTHDDVN